MKNSIKILGIAIVMASSIMINACKGDTGDVGPAGATGAKGDTGPAGTTGPRGETGAAGTAGTNGTNGTNGKDGVTGETGPSGSRGETGATGAQGPKGDPGTANVFYSDWISVPFTGSGTSWLGKINSTKITQEIIDKGLVFSFYRNPGSTHAIPIPDIYSDIDFVKIETQNVGFLQLKASVNRSSSKFRYIIIPGGVNIGSGRKKALQNMSYEEMKALYKIPD